MRRPAPPRPFSQARRLLLALVGLVLSGPVHMKADAGELLERSARIPVSIEALGGRIEHRDVLATVIREDAPGRHPFLLIEHGRAAERADRAALGVAAYPANARYFARMGFVVIIPTRIGYGATAGPDLEFTGDCTAKHYPRAMAAALEETRQLLDYVGHLPDVDPARGVIVGESFGGVLAIAAASAGLPGLTAAVSIAGGDGGDSVRHVDAPCQPERLGTYFASLGATNRLPTLWLYSLNDRLWGRAAPRQWFGAFTASGGRGTFQELPPDKNNGHYIFNRNPLAWHPAVEAFLAAHGYATEVQRGSASAPNRAR